MFNENRPMLHGRMLLNGRPGGADSLNTYEAACVAWAFLDERFSATAETLDPEGSQRLRHQLMGTQASEMAELAELREQMGAPNLVAVPAPPAADPKSELGDMMKLLSGDSPAP